ncbi:MAG: hypothetical protein EOO38_11965, partial [Cytophagaceae bacterium]
MDVGHLYLDPSRVTQVFINLTQDKYDIAECIWEVEIAGNGLANPLQSGGWFAKKLSVRNQSAPLYGYAEVGATGILYRRYDDPHDVRRDRNIATYYFPDLKSESLNDTLPHPATAIYARDTGKWRTSFNCSGTVTYGGRPFACWTVKQHVAPHGTLGLSDALKCSCNCWFYQAGNAAGIDAVSAVAEKFGIGMPSNSGLDQDNNSSFMPTQAWWATQNRGPWTSAKTANAAIGQGEVLATPLQMASVAAAVANGGKIWKQHLVGKSLVNGVWQAPAPEIEHDLLAEGTPAGALEAIRQGMWKTVNDTEGATGKLARSAIISMAGKTGTAQAWRTLRDTDGRAKGNVGDNHTWFIGFAPFEKPRY